MATEGGFDPRQLEGLLKQLLELVPESGMRSGLSAKKAQQLRAEILRVIDRLRGVARDLDPVKSPAMVLDPSDPMEIGRLIAGTMLQQPRTPMASLHPFYGAGVYAIYYTGAFAAYAPISGKEFPIYIGKADPERQDAETAEAQGTRLHRRLTEHKRSIEKAENLEVSDFECRYLVVKSAWQATSETLLIERFKPIWNNEVKVCYGFGKHGDAHGTRKNERSPWDTLHPGRPWATHEDNVPNKRTAQQILEDIGRHFERELPVIKADDWNSRLDPRE